MNRKSLRYGSLGLLSCLVALGFWCFAATPSQAHWADLSAAEILVDKAVVQMTLTFPTGLIPFADDDRSGQLSPTEVLAHKTELQDFLNQQIQLTNSNNLKGRLTIQPLEGDKLPTTVQIAPNSHSTLLLNYDWTEPIKGLTMRYGFFLPGVSTASCLATILQSGQLKTFVFTPKHQTLALIPGLGGDLSGSLLLAIAGAFVWGAIHSMTPGHGKTIVGSYLVGERATPRHALFLALVTTITHTIGVFALGLVTLFAAQYVLPEQLYPWLSLISGLMVVGIGCNLLIDRFKRNPGLLKWRDRNQMTRQSPHHPHHHDHHSHNYSHHADHDHELAYAQGNSLNQNHVGHLHVHEPMNYKADVHHDHHEHNHHEHSPHEHEHGHGPGQHTHLPPGADGAAVTWRSLLAMGISGGLVPCPAALLLLLSTIGFGQVGLGLVLVLSFSLGLAGVLTSLGLMLVYAKRLFQKVPSQLRPMQRLVKIMPIASAFVIMLVGCGISAKAFLQIGFI
jgi:nickel/cobalt transporter (NicO) family protein